MRIAIINDTHFGCKNSLQHFLDYQQDFIDNTLFPYCEKHGIKNILHLGDLFDNRKHITIRALNFTRTSFFEKLRTRGMTMDILPGNHDTSYKNTNNLCTLVEVLQHYEDCIRVHMDPVILKYDDFPVALVPWMAADNKQKCLDFIASANASVIVGHFELAGFKYIGNSNVKSEGHSRDIFAKYDMVLSGHYHSKSTGGNVTYLGAQYQFNWSDVDDLKYFHILDTSTRELTPVENPTRIYNKFYYDDSNATTVADLIDPNLHSECTIRNKYVRIIVQNKKDFHLFDLFIERIKSFDPYDLSIVENYETVATSSDSTETIEDTATLIDNYVDKVLETNLNKDRIKKILHQLHTEAMALDLE